MNLHNLQLLAARSKKRVGRGLGSGKGKTSGRGQKGQKARGTTPLAAVGGGIFLYKKLPYNRGHSRRGTQNTRSPKSVTIKVGELSVFNSKEVVNLSSLIDRKLVNEKEAKKKGVKILQGGKLETALTIELPVSVGVRKLVEKAGGKVV